MLYKKVAIDPDLFNGSFDRFRIFMADAREGTGRFYAALPRGWAVDIRHLGPSSSTMQRARLSELMIQARRYIVRAGFEFDGGRAWCENAADCARQAGLDCIVLSKGEPDPNSCLIGFDWMEHDQSPWRISESKTAEPTSQRLMADIKRLVHESSVIKLIDRYLNPQIANYARSLNHLMAACGPRVEQIQFHIPFIEPSGGRGQMESLPAARFKGVALENLEIPDGMDVIVLRWKDSDAGPDMHDRYLVTELGGVHTGRGFPDEPDREATTGRLSKEDRIKIWERYDDFDPAPIQLVDRIRLS